MGKSGDQVAENNVLGPHRENLYFETKCPSKSRGNEGETPARAQEIALQKRWNIVEINGQSKCDWSEKVGALRAAETPVQKAAGRNSGIRVFETTEHQ
ncbi:MAG: hypothetical protein ABSG52_09250 [Terriglobales bacterium]|jgi:hypothetical protein